jgi:flagellar assembly protein FliH
MKPKKHSSSEANEPGGSPRMSVSPMVYPAVAGWAVPSPPAILDDIASPPTVSPAGKSASASAGATKAPEGQARMFLESDVRAAETAARQKGFQEGQAQAKQEADALVAKERDAIGAALREFSNDRDVYFHNVEGEVVSLALAIVRKILKREAQVDPMLLAGMVRVALERIGAAKNIRMRVHPSQIPDWRAYFESAADLTQRPELSGDGSLDFNSCELETEMGTTELNLDTQLKEIEVGLFDLLAQRPSPK